MREHLATAVRRYRSQTQRARHAARHVAPVPPQRPGCAPVCPCLEPPPKATDVGSDGRQPWGGKHRHRLFSVHASKAPRASTASAGTALRTTDDTNETRTRNPPPSEETEATPRGEETRSENTILVPSRGSPIGSRRLGPGSHPTRPSCRTSTSARARWVRPKARGPNRFGGQQRLDRTPKPTVLVTTSHT